MCRAQEPGKSTYDEEAWPNLNFCPRESAEVAGTTSVPPGMSPARTSLTDCLSGAPGISCPGSN